MTTHKTKSPTDQLIERVEAAFAQGLAFAYIEVGRYKGCSVSTVRALARRGYRIERKVLGGAYHIFPKPKQEKLYPVYLTEGEIIAIRELTRKYPRGDEFAKDYAEELRTLDNKTTAKLADIFDENNGLKK